MDYDLPPELTVESIGAVRVVTLNRPDKLNAVSQPMHRALEHVWEQIAADPDARAAVLTGAGSTFCAGGDVSNFVLNHNDVNHRRRSIRGARQLFDAMMDFPLPLVAAVNGPAIGLGCTIAVSCDLVLMADTATMAESHVAIGLVAGDGGTALWPQMMSILKAKELVLLGDRITADEAVRIGLANRAVPAASIRDEALALAQRLAALPPQSVQMTKRAFNLHLKRAALDVMDFSLQAEFESFGTEQAKLTAERLLSRSKKD